jgi:hypothetical protein
MMIGIRNRLTYANVMSSIAVFLLLGGGAAIAAKQLGKNSVGTKQLKKNAITKAKIKKNAVTAAKIKKGAVTRAKLLDGAVDGAKVADGSLTGADINAGAVPYGQVVHRAGGGGPVSVPEGGLVALPLSSPVYTQAAGRNDSYIGAIDLTFNPSCAAPRSATGVVLVDAVNPTEPSQSEIASAGVRETVSTQAERINMSPFIANGVRYAPTAATPHTVTAAVTIECSGGGGSATAAAAGIDVIGVK